MTLQYKQTNVGKGSQLEIYKINNISFLYENIDISYSGLWGRALIINDSLK